MHLLCTTRRATSYVWLGLGRESEILLRPFLPSSGEIVFPSLSSQLDSSKCITNPTSPKIPIHYSLTALRPPDWISLRQKKKKSVTFTILFYTCTVRGSLCRKYSSIIHPDLGIHSGWKIGKLIKIRLARLYVLTFCNDFNPCYCHFLVKLVAHLWVDFNVDIDNRWILLCEASCHRLRVEFVINLFRQVHDCKVEINLKAIMDWCNWIINHEAHSSRIFSHFLQQDRHRVLQECRWMILSSLSKSKFDFLLLYLFTI